MRENAPYDLKAPDYQAVSSVKAAKTLIPNVMKNANVKVKAVTPKVSKKVSTPKAAKPSASKKGLVSDGSGGSVNITDVVKEVNAEFNAKKATESKPKKATKAEIKAMVAVAEVVEPTPKPLTSEEKTALRFEVEVDENGDLPRFSVGQRVKFIPHVKSRLFRGKFVDMVGSVRSFYLDADGSFYFELNVKGSYVRPYKKSDALKRA